ncbi:MAG: alpha/beta hydrolase, partial [Thermomicrobiales bacterium]
SFGGLVARLYASTYPEDVVGMVLVDAAQEDYYAAIRRILTPAQWDAFADPGANPEYPGLERIDTATSAIQMRTAAAASPLRPMPLVVLTHGKPWEWPPGFPAAALEAVWLPLQERLAALVPDARLIVAEESGHFIQLQQPGLVTDAIRAVVDAVRTPGTWERPATPAVVSGHAERAPITGALPEKRSANRG